MTRLTCDIFQLKAAHRELENKMKQKDAELTNLREQHSHLLQLSRDKQLFERDKLTKKLASLEFYSKEQNDKIIVSIKSRKKRVYVGGKWKF